MLATRCRVHKERWATPSRRSAGYCDHLPVAGGPARRGGRALGAADGERCGYRDGGGATGWQWSTIGPARCISAPDASPPDFHPGRSEVRMSSSQCPETVRLVDDFRTLTTAVRVEATRGVELSGRCIRASDASCSLILESRSLSFILSLPSLTSLSSPSSPATAALTTSHREALRIGRMGDPWSPTWSSATLRGRAPALCPLTTPAAGVADHGHVT